MRGIGKGGTRQCLFESERTLTRTNDCALNNVLQLPNVARPIVCDQRRHRLWIDAPRHGALPRYGSVEVVFD
ncbi:MAG: hypothetical protein DMF60_17175 [Acidobacteria bacterium]|nr:MAG: hypothetical protein DMF60_17175 [Acidobacteriota bacterium]